MSEKHTAGPWYVVRSRDQMGSFGTTVWHDGKSVGVYSDAEVHGDPLADAYVIAASLDLLKAAKEHEKFWAQREQELGSLSGDAMALRAINLAAISLATKEQSA